MQGRIVAIATIVDRVHGEIEPGPDNNEIVL
jgi:hypothetical protein